MEPIFFKPVYKNVIWGGNNIAKILDRNILGEDIGESWELSAHRNGLSVIINGEFKGKNLYELFSDKENKTKIFGARSEKLNKFPILIKFIDAKEKLSIQVHPDNEYALKNENDLGKNEVWYVMDCKENAKIVYGFKENIEKKNLKNVIDNIEENVNYINVQKGDFIIIPAGTIHAIMDGILICEVQQSSDVTYRVYDWNRKDKNGNYRKLHKEQAIDVIKLENKNAIINYSNIRENINMYKSDLFNVDMVIVNDMEEYISNKETFFAYTVIEGKRENNCRKF